jgi:hypothetical protein
VVSVPPDRKVDGTPVHLGRMFPIHVGDVRGTATASLLVTNVSSGDAAVDVFVGSAGAGGAGKYTNPRLRIRNIWRIDLQPEDANTHLVLRSDADVIVQLVVDDGRLEALTVLPAVGG